MKKQGRALRQKEQHLQSPEGLEGVIQSGDGVIWQERAWGPVVGRRIVAPGLEGWAMRWGLRPVSQENPVMFVSQEGKQSTPVLGFLH